MSENKRRGNWEKSDRGPPKKKGYWQPSFSAEKAIPLGAVGMLVTCDAGRDRKAAAEMTSLFEEVSANMGYKLGSSTADDGGAAAASAGGDADAAGGAAASKPASIDALLAAEVAELKSKKAHAFKWHDTGVKSTVFIECVKDSGAPPPVELVTAVMRHVMDTKQLPARHSMRLLPVERTCFPNLEEVTAMAAEVAKEHFPQGEGVEGTTFAVEFEHRSCNTLKRNEVVDAFAKAVPSPPHKVDLGAPKKTILVQLVRNVAGVAVVEDYKELLRLNVRKAVEEPEEAEAGQQQQQQQQPKPQQQEAEAEGKGEQQKGEGGEPQQDQQNAEAVEATGE